jgi:hypothetical protein
MTHAEFGHMELNVEGSILNGMRTLGGTTLSAAKNRFTCSGYSDVSGGGSSTGSSRYG